MEGNFNISDEDWEKICKTQWKSTSSAMWRELCWKNVIRFSITPSQKKHHGKGISAGDHVGKRKLTTTIFWGGCQKLTPYWQEIKRNVEAVFEVEIVFNCDSIFG